MRSTKAAATNCVGSAQITANCDYFSPTVTATNPAGLSIFDVRKTDDKQAAKALIRYVFYMGREWGKLLLSHCAPPCVVVREALGVASVQRFLRFNQYTSIFVG